MFFLLSKKLNKNIHKVHYLKDLIIWLILINVFNYLLIHFTTKVDWVDWNGLKCYANMSQQDHSNYKCYTSVFRYYINMKHLILNKEKEKDIRAYKEVQIRLLSSFWNTACHHVIHRRIGNILVIIDCWWPATGIYISKRILFPIQEKLFESTTNFSSKWINTSHLNTIFLHHFLGWSSV